MNKLILDQLSGRLDKIGKELGFHKLIMRSNGSISEIYIANNHALELEIDWHENNLFMYAVYLKNKEIPKKGIVYRYEDGQWCRKYLEEIYKTKRPDAKNTLKRYSETYLLDCFEFYIDLIHSSTDILKIFGVTGKT